MYISLCDIKIMFSWGEVGRKWEGKKIEKKKSKIKKLDLKLINYFYLLFEYHFTYFEFFI